MERESRRFANKAQTAPRLTSSDVPLSTLGIAAYSDEEDDGVEHLRQEPLTKKQEEPKQHASPTPKPAASEEGICSTLRRSANVTQVPESETLNRDEYEQNGVDDARLCGQGVNLPAPPVAMRLSDDGACTIDAEWGLPNEHDLANGRNIDKDLITKLERFHELKRNGTHFNISLSRNRAFHNPHIYAKLVDWVHIDETASAFPEMVRRSHQHSKPKDELSKEPHNLDTDAVWIASESARSALKEQGGAEKIALKQRQKMEEAECSKEHRSKIDFVSGGIEQRAERKAGLPPVPKSSSSNAGADSKRYDYREEVARRAQKIKEELARRPEEHSKPSERGDSSNRRKVSEGAQGPEKRTRADQDWRR